MCFWYYISILIFSNFQYLFMGEQAQVKNLSTIWFDPNLHLKWLCVSLMSRNSVARSGRGLLPGGQVALSWMPGAEASAACTSYGARNRGSAITVTQRTVRMPPGSQKSKRAGHRQTSPRAKGVDMSVLTVLCRRLATQIGAADESPWTGQSLCGSHWAGVLTSTCPFWCRHCGPFASGRWRCLYNFLT
jgi:hypothetical protein